MTRLYAIALGCLLLPAALPAEESGGSAVLRGRDTIAVERFTREDGEVNGRLARGPGPGTRGLPQHPTARSVPFSTRAPGP